LLFVFLFVAVVILFEVAGIPGIVAYAVIGDQALVDDDAFGFHGLQLHVAEVERGGLQGVEQESGDFGIELSGEDEAHDLHEGDLDGVGVLKHGHGKAERGGGLRVQLDALALPVLVKETEAASAKSRGAALSAIGFDMSATRNMNVIQHHEKCSTPLPHGLME
jgi:hypothetical protein